MPAWRLRKRGEGRGERGGRWRGRQELHALQHDPVTSRLEKLPTGLRWVAEQSLAQNRMRSRGKANVPPGLTSYSDRPPPAGQQAAPALPGSCSRHAPRRRAGRLGRDVPREAVGAPCEGHGHGGRRDVGARVGGVGVRSVRQTAGFGRGAATRCGFFEGRSSESPREAPREERVRVRAVCVAVESIRCAAE